jgi:hypothetical protein
MVTTVDPAVLICSELRRDVEAYQHTIESFARELQSICEAAIVRLFPANKPAASRVLAGLDTANRMLTDLGVTDAPAQQPQYAPIDDSGLWLPDVEAQRYLQPQPQPQPQPAPWAELPAQPQAQPPLPVWLPDVAAGHLAAYQLLQQQQQQQFEQQLAHRHRKQRQLRQQVAAPLTDHPQPMQEDSLLQQPQSMSMQEFLQLPHQEQRYQQLLHQRQQAAAAANWERQLLGTELPDPMRRAPRQSVHRRQSAALSSGSSKRKDANADGTGHAHLANGSARGGSSARAAKKPKVRCVCWLLTSTCSTTADAVAISGCA